MTGIILLGGPHHGQTMAARDRINDIVLEAPEADLVTYTRMPGYDDYVHPDLVAFTVFPYQVLIAEVRLAVDPVALRHARIDVLEVTRARLLIEEEKAHRHHPRLSGTVSRFTEDERAQWVVLHRSWLAARPL